MRARDDLYRYLSLVTQIEGQPTVSTPALLIQLDKGAVLLASSCCLVRDGTMVDSMFSRYTEDIHNHKQQPVRAVVKWREILRADGNSPEHPFYCLVGPNMPEARRPGPWANTSPHPRPPAPRVKYKNSSADHPWKQWAMRWAERDGEEALCRIQHGTKTTAKLCPGG